MNTVKLFLVSKQSHIAATTFEFKNAKLGIDMHVRVYKDKEGHDEWCALKEGEFHNFDIAALVEAIEAEPEAEKEPKSKKKKTE